MDAALLKDVEVKAKDGHRLGGELVNFLAVERETKRKTEANLRGAIPKMEPSPGANRKRPKGTWSFTMS